MPGLSFTQKTNSTKNTLDFKTTSDKPMATLVNINNISMWAHADGLSARSPYKKKMGVIYPRGTAGVVYADGIVWGGVVRDGNEVNRWGNKYLVRVGGSRYKSGLQAGRIITKGVPENPADHEVRIWRIRRDWQTADLKQDAAEFFNVRGDTTLHEDFSISVDSVTQHQVDSVRVQYKKDWTEWPWQKGAPFYDKNKNGIMDKEEEPGLAYADQVVWFVANDLDSLKTIKFLGSPPIGMEMQVTLWAYNRKNNQSDEVLSNLHNVLQNVIFKRIRLIYKGCADIADTTRIDSMYLAQWSDVDIGKFSEDLVGCDTLLDLGYGYNGVGDDDEYLKFNLHPPSIGYCFLIGPNVPSKGDQAFFNFKIKNNFNNLYMTSFAWWSPLSILIDFWSGYNGTLNMYQMLRGYLVGTYPDHDPYPFPPGIESNKFPLSGDPITGNGFLDGMGADYSFPPGDRRFVCSSGPFTMALGDTQEVIIALVGGIGADRLSSISVMKHNTRWIRSWMPYIFEMGFPEEKPPETEKAPIPDSFRLFQNYPNPFNAETEICYDLPIQRNVKLTIYNLLGEEVKVLKNKNQLAGSYSVKWDGKDRFGNKVPTGVYLYCLEAGYWIISKKMMLLQ